MKKTTIAALLLFASSLCAQVQIGKNVQIGGTATGSSFTLNTLSGNVTLNVGAGLSLSAIGNTLTLNLTAPVTPLTISSFTGGSSQELGFPVVNPAFAATYTGTPTSANITNTDSIDSPHTLTTPFTSATLSGTFTKTTTASTTFTLRASDGTNNPTATEQITWNPRIFGGVGAVGATSSVTASGTTAVLSTSDALPSAGLGAETVGQVFGPYSPSSQAIYLLLTGGSHTFTDAGTGFPFAFNAPITVTFVNVNGVSMTLYLYQSTNPLAGTFSPKIAS